MDLKVPGFEARWITYWDENKIYEFHHDGDSEKYFTIDTPPPTISGKIHMGHAFSYPHQDFIARYKRMRGYNVFYPWGHDDNGLPTERYTEKTRNIRAERTDLLTFIEACRESSREAREAVTRTFIDIGLSANFRDEYTTSSPFSRRLSQSMFLDLVKRDRVYREKAPAIRCPFCHTAISQIEMKDVSRKADFVYINFPLDQGESIQIATTRPEYVGACVAIGVNPDDERYKDFIGSDAKVPLYNHAVKIIADPMIEKDKGTGAEMICTFGDQNDLDLWRKHNLDLRVLIDDMGRMNDLSDFLKGLKIEEARKKIIEILKEKNFIEKIERIEHFVNTHERCGTPVEIGISKQWFIRYLDLRYDFLQYGKKVNWIPEHMRVRYDNWVNGLRWDWCISRQRYFGIPFPVWYCKECGETVFADESELPVDPRLDEVKKKCNKCGSSDLIPETDIMDTWATSSLSPRITLLKESMFEEQYPMDVRFQGHDIITFWAFTTIARARIHDGVIPWKNIFISGNVHDPLGQKMSKSKGNIVEPSTIISEYGPDSLRFWASTTLPGEDIRIKEQDFVRGRRTVIKLYNAARLVSMLSEGRKVPEKIESPKTKIDQWILSKLNTTVDEVTKEMENYTVSKARAELDNFFWNTFCDNYLEIIKSQIKVYSNDPASEQLITEMLATAKYSMLQIIKMYAPVMPFITEEIYSTYEYPGKKKSIHLESWPRFEENYSFPDIERETDYVIQAIGKIRTLKSSMRLSLAASIDRVMLKGDKKTLENSASVIKGLMNIKELELVDSEEVEALLPQ